MLLHSGMLLLMANELIVARYAVEWQVFLMEGQTQQLRPRHPHRRAGHDRQLRQGNRRAHRDSAARSSKPTIARTPGWQSRAKTQRSSPTRTNLLPVKVAVLRVLSRTPTSRIASRTKSRLPTAGCGLSKKSSSSGPPPKAPTRAAASIWRRLMCRSPTRRRARTSARISSRSSPPSRTGPTGPERFAENVAVGDKKYHLFLRFKREYKPYTIKLLDVRKDDYVASDTPRNYSSDIQLVDKQSGVDKPVHIKMNNPLRYAGETFYQSGYHPPGMTGGKEATTLAVVRNTGWMIPYVACMIVAIGMLAHFLITVTRFVGRRESEEMAAGDVIGQWRPWPTSTQGQQGQEQLAKRVRTIGLGLAQHCAVDSGGRHFCVLRRQGGPRAAAEARRNGYRGLRPDSGRAPGPREAARYAGPQHAARHFAPRDAEARERRDDVRDPVAPGSDQSARSGPTNST